MQCRSAPSIDLRSAPTFYRIKPIPAPHTRQSIFVNFTPYRVIDRRPSWGTENRRPNPSKHAPKSSNRHRLRLQRVLTRACCAEVAHPFSTVHTVITIHPSISPVATCILHSNVTGTCRALAPFFLLVRPPCLHRHRIAAGRLPSCSTSWPPPPSRSSCAPRWQHKQAFDAAVAAHLRRPCREKQPPSFRLFHSVGSTG